MLLLGTKGNINMCLKSRKQVMPTVFLTFSLPSLEHGKVSPTTMAVNHTLAANQLGQLHMGQ